MQFIETVIIMVCATKSSFKTWYHKQGPLIKKKKRVLGPHTKEGTAQTEKRSQSNCYALYNDDGEQTKSIHQGAMEMNRHKRTGDSTIGSVLTHTNRVMHLFAPVSRSGVQNDRMRHLLRDRAQQAQAWENFSFILKKFMLFLSRHRGRI